MGKNQIYKAMQRARHNGEFDTTEPEGGANGTFDVSFHSPEWHAARMESLQNRRMTWEEWKQKSKEEEYAKSKLHEEEERVMSEYRAQLAADRERKLRKNKSHKKKKKKSDHHKWKHGRKKVRPNSIHSMR
eukprot:g5045.t1